MAQQWIDNALNSLASRMTAAGRKPIGHRANGAPIWPIFGAEDDPANPVPPPAADPPPADPPADPGFPANTPLEQMNVEQREAYWKDKARKHEDRNKAFGKLTPEELADLRSKAEKHDELELELGTEADKKAAEARKAASAEADARYQPLLVQAKFEAAAAGRIEPEKLATILEPLDLSKFLTTDGTPDADKVRAYVDGIAPAMGTPPPPRTGPSSNGMGNRGKSTPGVGSVAAGRDLYAETHPKK
jgi:hypothetical protein